MNETEQAIEFLKIHKDTMVNAEARKALTLAIIALQQRERLVEYFEDAINDLVRHNEDYGYITPDDKITKFRQLLTELKEEK